MNSIDHDQHPITAFTQLWSESIAELLEYVEQIFYSEEFSQRYEMLYQALVQTQSAVVLWIQLLFTISKDLVSILIHMLISAWPYLQTIPGRTLALHKQHPEIVLAELLGIILCLVGYIASKYILPYIKQLYQSAVSAISSVYNSIYEAFRRSYRSMISSVQYAKQSIVNSAKSLKKYLIDDLLLPLIPHLLIIIPAIAIVIFLPSILSYNNIHYFPLPLRDMISVVYPAFKSVTLTTNIHEDVLFKFAQYWICFGVITFALDILAGFTFIARFFSFLLEQMGYETFMTDSTTLYSALYIITFVWLQLQGAPVLHWALQPVLVSWNKIQLVLAGLVEKLLGALVLVGVLKQQSAKDLSCTVVDGLFLLPAAFLVLSMQGLAYLGFLYVLLLVPTMRTHRSCSQLPRGRNKKKLILLDHLYVWSIVSLYYSLVEHSSWLSLFKQVPLYYNLQLLLAAILLFPGSPGISFATESLRFSVQKTISTKNLLVETFSARFNLS